MKEEPLRITAPVFNIQGYCIHDGPGIRTTVFVKGCPLNCLWCQNPESNSPRPQLMYYKNKCTGCGRCLGVCPQKAVQMELSEGKAWAKTDRSLCISCGLCTDVCPSEARETAGKDMSVEEVLKRVAEDKIFYDSSGGGMTISGGEALMHPDFAESLLRECQKQGIHTAIETCSFASRETIDRVFAHVDLGLLDIKHMDSARHKELTGVPNEEILENIRHICRDLKVPAIIRVPVIPGCNDSRENIEATARFTAEELGPEVPVHLLPYHNLGEAKNESLGRTSILNMKAPSKERMEELRQLAASHVRNVQVGGSV
ncbi:glycyl-radical enzyme activating protein [Clostridium sp. MCC353]|uniref:glycyl-radical enzyme activating protein n=1 Tax=Clostridium sp. MCC353 TaxID=2592646 RepID=UPI001C0200D4|nr:glycyl-radical enzyme activating protein [Clostridium sp. MCC353]MBT9775495.1 glycyl-radical enzyme activating protein [Clostridium sp. MCC353]